MNLPLYALGTESGIALAHGGSAVLGGDPSDAPEGSYPIHGHAPPVDPASLGDISFCADHGIRFPYVAGAMANGVASEEIVEAMGRAGMIGFFGAAGLALDRVEAAIDRIQANLGLEEGSLAYGFNLIHSPHEPEMEAGVVDLYLRRGVRLVSAAAYLRLTLPLIRYRVHGIHRDEEGNVVAPNRVVAKVSRVEVARRMFSPPPAKLLGKLVEAGDITEEQARMAETIPVAQDLTAEADSGGHTDNRPFVTLLPTMLALRDELQAEFGYRDRLRVGAGGGIGTPASAAAAFAMGAAYILTGSINQACVESGTSDVVREMLWQTRQADVMMAPAADMFEMGVRVQVLKRGTMFAMRAAKLYEFFRAYGSLEEMPPEQRAVLERDYFRAPIDRVWEQTRSFFAERDPKQIDRADREPKHKMALLFRWYLGVSSVWAKAGDPDRKIDYQIWCGPSMGAFNEWAKGSFLEAGPERRVETIALNLLLGAATLWRIRTLGAGGVVLDPALSRFAPRPLQELKELLN